MVAALTEASANLIDDPPNSQELLDRAREAARGCQPLCRLAELAQAALEEQGFVQVRGFPLEHARRLFVAFSCLMGEPYIDPAIGSALVPAHVRPGEVLMGNQLRRLPLHTDYSMMERPPRLTMSCCLRTDPVKDFGAVYVADIESACFGVENDPVIVRLKSVCLPFAALNARNEVDVITRPILGKTADGRITVRYHRSRIYKGFCICGQVPTEEQLQAMLTFESLAQSVVQVLYPQAGDITIIDNHRTVHGRERCSVEVHADGTTTGRQMLFLFAY
ncbi:MAG: TauD/TfdA family dioxygenase [Gemmatales bacterium]|nr:TauD/TfdA family dioxygenase [Gemmatales bacterium]MDW8388032.1 TauD/TfdA family dioxygenase [Gemmatales bacterium]